MAELKRVLARCHNLQASSICTLPFEKTVAEGGVGNCFARSRHSCIRRLFISLSSSSLVAIGSPLLAWILSHQGDQTQPGSIEGMPHLREAGEAAGAAESGGSFSVAMQAGMMNFG